MEFAGTGNVLLECAFLQRTGLKFDERFRFAGGEDSFFFLQARLVHGAKLVGAAEAVAWEHIPEARTSMSWLLKRRFRTANGLAHYERFSNAPLTRHVLRCVKGLGRLVFGVLVVPVGVLVGRHIMVKGLMSIAAGCGMLLGLLGLAYEEYGDRKTLKFIGSR